ncbi:MAG: hypothetical protein AB1813_13715, partial [Verrucomicrobiota bacterium]
GLLEFRGDRVACSFLDLVSSGTRGLFSTSGLGTTLVSRGAGAGGAAGVAAGFELEAAGVPPPDNASLIM